MILDSISSSGNYAYSYTGAEPNPQAISFSNDGSADATVEIGGKSVTVKPAEVFDGSFPRFTAADITATGAWRLIVKR
jgi:hypothetical protein